MIANERLLTAGDAADILQMPTAKVSKFAKRNQIPHVRLPDGEIRFVEADLWRWICTCKEPGQGATST